jgi:hypothetical protein
MTPPTAANNGGQRFEPAPARVDVPVTFFDDIADAPLEYQRFMRFVDSLRSLGFDGVVDVDARLFELSPTHFHQED